MKNTAMADCGTTGRGGSASAVGNGNTVSLGNLVFQLNNGCWRNTLAGQTIIVHEHLDERVSIRYGLSGGATTPHRNYSGDAVRAPLQGLFWTTLQAGVLKI